MFWTICISSHQRCFVDLFVYQLLIYLLTGVNCCVWKLQVKISSRFARVNPYPAKLIYLKFQLLEVVSRYRDPQPQVI